MPAAGRQRKFWNGSTSSVRNSVNRARPPGSLVSYSYSTIDLFRNAAVFVDRILKGRKPAELPFEQPTHFEVMLNMKTAKSLGLTIPQTVLIRADRVIE